MKKDKRLIEDGILDLMDSSMVIKVGVYIVIGLAGMYVLGHAFKIGAHCVRGYKELTLAIKQ